MFAFPREKTVPSSLETPSYTDTLVANTVKDGFPRLTGNKWDINGLSSENQSLWVIR